MKIWTVQCTFAAYYANIVEIQADSLDEALERAIESANETDAWRALDDCGRTFVDAVAEGADTDPWQGFRSAIPVPARFTERGAPPTVTVIVAGDTVQDVRVEGSARVVVRDYDTDGANPGDPDLRIDEEGNPYAVAEWGEPVSAT